MQPIRIESISKSYRGKKRTLVRALQDLTLDICSGEVVGFLGPNGAGKSTTIKILMGQIRADAGTAWLFDIPVHDANARKRVGYLPENPSFYDFLSAREYLDLVGRAFGMSTGAIKQKSEHVLELLDLKKAAKRPIRGYSKGMTQRLGIAQTLLHEPDLFILDEPMSGLDPLGRALVKEIMADLKKQGKTIFFSTHVTADVEAVCDRVAVIVGGKLRSQSVVKDVLQAGIEGYSVHIEARKETVFEGFKLLAERNGLFEIYVPRAQFDEFTAKLVREGAKVQLIEPCRNNLEAFFLDIVNREGS
jgi:ABC-2 type transport system ATP-binding protein